MVPFVRSTALRSGRPGRAARASAQVGRYFHIKERKSTFTTEMRAGVVTFLTACESRRRLGPMGMERRRRRLPAAAPRTALGRGHRAGTASCLRLAMGGSA